MPIDYVKAVTDAFKPLIHSIPKEDSDALKESTAISEQLIEYSNPWGASRQPLVLFKLYVFLLEKRQKEKTNTPTPYTAQLLFGKDCFIDKIKALIIADHSTEFQEFIQSTDQSSFELIKEEYGLNDSKLMTKYEQILASVTTATNSLVNTFRNFQSSFIFPFWKKSPAATQISAPYNCGGPFNKYFPVSKIPENFKSSKFEPLDYAEEAFFKGIKNILLNSDVSDKVVQSPSFESFYNAEKAFLQEQSQILTSQRAIFDAQIKGLIRIEDSDYCQQALDYQGKCLTYLDSLLNPSEGNLVNRDEYAEVKNKFELCQNQYTNFLESLQVLKNQNIMQQAEVDNAEVQNNQARTLDFGNVDNFENKTHSIRLTIVRRTQLLDQNPVCEDQLGSDFSFG